MQLTNRYASSHPGMKSRQICGVCDANQNTNPNRSGREAFFNEMSMILVPDSPFNELILIRWLNEYLMS